MMTKVKICGITNLEDALLAAEFGADLIGFNFYEKSPRYVSPQEALKITYKLSEDIITVGVFVNQVPRRIAEVVDLLDLNAVQLHGDENAGYVREIKREVKAMIIKAFRVNSDLQAENVLEFNIDAVLLDAFSADHYGGTGESFDWNIAKAVKDLIPELYLAGGLNSENVGRAIKTVRPFAVDVASGVESSPGKKDPKKVEAFIRNAKNA